MTAPLPTEEIAKIIAHWHHGGHVSACDMNAAGGILARLRPASEPPHLREENQKLREANRRLQAQGEELERDKLIVSLRASLARKDEALRACVEALVFVRSALDAMDSNDSLPRVHEVYTVVNTALARAQEAGR